MRMALAERLTPEQAAAVFRRAAELQAAGLRGETEAVLDDAALEDIGREVGLSPASIHGALAELRSAAATATAPAVAWGTVVRCRTVHAHAGEVAAFLDDRARQSLMTVVQHGGPTMVWAPPSGAAATIVRGLRGRRRYPLLVLKELRATVTEAQPELTRVCLEGSLRFPLSLLPARSQALAALGVAGGAFVAFGIDGTGHTDWAFDAAGALLSLAGAGIGLRGYRRAVAKAERALSGVLDYLTYGVDPPLWWPPASS
jgi:hypothetical protein